MRKNKILFVFCLVMTSMACSKEVPPYQELTDSKEGAIIYVAKANSGIQNLSIFPYSDEERVYQFGASFGALGLPANDIRISFIEDLNVFDSLNNIRRINNLEPYVRFPADSYTLDKLDLVIPKGEMSSDLSTLSYKSTKFDSAKDYLLALSIDKASGYPQNPLAKTLLIVAPKLEERPANTQGWIATASSEQLTGETTGLASAVLDGNLNTIWHARYNPSPEAKYPHWLSFDMINERYVTKVSIATRQNNLRGMTKFKLEGSRDGENWFSLTDELNFDPTNIRYQTYQIEPQYLKNIKITLLQGLQNLTFLSEFVVYSY